MHFLRSRCEASVGIIVVIIATLIIDGVVSLEVQVVSGLGTQKDARLLKKLDLPATFPVQKNCGKQKIQPSINASTLNRIINGQEAVSNSWPWVVSIRLYGFGYVYGHICAGVLLSPQHVLTAAHCLIDLIRPSGYSLVVAAGIHNISDISRSTVYFVRQFGYHSKYNRITFANDIALLKLNNSVTLSDKVAVICLPTSSANSSDVLNKKVEVVGWGVLDGYQNSTSARKLQQTTLRVLNNYTYCKQQDPNFDSNYRYCAVADNHLSNVCYGDSGGPLMYYNNGSWYSYGIISSGVYEKNRKCLQSSPSYYTQIAKFLDWLGLVWALL